MSYPYKNEKAVVETFMYFETRIPIRFNKLGREEIARRLDAHEELVAALKYALKHFGGTSWAVDNPSMLEPIKQALAKAGAKV